MKCYGCDGEILTGHIVKRIEVASWSGTFEQVCHERCGITLIRFNGKIFMKVKEVDDVKR